MWPILMLDETPLLGGVNIPEPVFFCSIEPPSMTYQVSSMILYVDESLYLNMEIKSNY